MPERNAVMTPPAREIDLRDTARSRLQVELFHLLEGLGDGEAAELLLAEPPELLLESANLYLRGRLRWRVTPGPNAWRVRVERHQPARATDLRDFLTQDHQRANALFARILALLNAGDLSSARPLVEELGRALRRHIHVENEILAPQFTGVADQGAQAPVAQMRHEHEEILAQVSTLECLSAEGGEDALLELQVLAGLLSGMLAKHEGREEQNVFPAWEAARRRREAPGLLEEVEAVITGRRDEELFGTPPPPETPRAP